MLSKAIVVWEQFCFSCREGAAVDRRISSHVNIRDDYYAAISVHDLMINQARIFYVLYYILWHVFHGTYYLCACLLSQ